ncbi:MAG: PEGA domain-containing protein [Fibrobacteres bacterium]|jgi:TolA-binding protein|nr:PEGA domain-containing protein [Fibrobacterota bacterium]
MNAPNHNPGAPRDPDHRLRLFVSLLKQDVEVPRDFSKMEKALLERIQKADALGPFAVLKVEETPPPGFFDKVEADLMTRFQNHREYEQPVNDVIAAPVKPSGMELHRIESRLDERIDLARRLEPWELVVKAGEVLPLGRWEAIEESLFARIEQHRKLDLIAPAHTWLGLGLFRSTPLRIAAGLALAAVASLGAWKSLRRPSVPLETLVYQAQGATASEIASAFPQGRPDLHGRADILSRDDGAMTLVNQRGFVEMHNGSRLQIEEADQKKIRYRVAFAGHGHAARGNVTFFVSKRKAGEKYQVATPDYRIDVVGTYFRVRPDLGGRVATSVLEGSVKIHSDVYGDFEVAAGQSLVYDAATERYRVQDGGASVRREDIETVPGVDELSHYGVVTVTSNEPGAEVRVDDRFKGATPLVVLLPPGRHSLQLSKDGHPPLDTAVTVAFGGTHRLALALPEAAKHIAKTLPAPARPSAVNYSPAPAPAPQPIQAAPSQAEEADLIYRKAEQIQSADWQGAIQLYRQVLENPDAPPLRKDDALFSVARLRAEHEKDKTQAREDFLRYLAMYPDGAFAGESWLRLAELEVGRNQGKAIEYYLRSMEKMPHHPRMSEMQHRVGLLYLQNKRYDEAIAMFRQSLGNILYANESEKRKIYQSLYRALVAKGDNLAAGEIAKEYRFQDDSAGK